MGAAHARLFAEEDAKVVIGDIKCRSTRPDCVYDGTVDRATQAAVTSAVPLGRMADPMEVSYAVLFWPLMNRLMSRAELVVDGGMIAH
jgi:NAD(P)-dependent dehydrogenase (short-subunit alcohol dehydrogenase family)